MSRSEATALLTLAESIADGSPVDWDVAEALATGDERAVVRQLRILSSLAGLHRSLPSIPGDLPPASAARRAAIAPAIGSWAHLELIERLGGGTFGEVYRAWDRHLEREVALKLLRGDEHIDDLHASRIANEGRLLARVRHPNVITVHGVDAHEQRVGLWMDLVRGTTLEQQLVAHGPFSAREAAVVGIDLCRALAAIHAAGLIHRDVKAQNVMREDGGRIVLMDLGTGRETDPTDHRGVPDLAGTPLYLAPELFGGAHASERTDLYSLGVLLYHLVTGAFPVAATTIPQLRDGHRKGSAVRLRDARADLPTAFVRVVERAIAADASKRYESAGALEADLVEALADPVPVTVPALPVPAPEPRAWQLTGWPALALIAAAIIIIGLVAVPWPPPFGRAPAPIRSIAVLPLVNLSGDPAQDYFADGMTDLLIGDLAKIRALRVISRTSAMQFKGSKQSLKDIAKALNVDAVLEGSVQRSGDRVRISADLVHAGTDRHVWVESYERDVRDVLALQNEVARAIARGVQIQLTPQEQAGFATAAAQRQVNPAAQEAYLQGRFYWNRRKPPEAYQRALEFFHQAETIDPTFALAYAGEADAYSLLAGSMPPTVAYPLAKAAANRALQLDPALAEAHTSLAFASFIFDRDWPQAEAGFQRALQYNPGYATAHHWYGIYLSAMGRFAESEAEFVRAKALDPLSASIRTSFGSMLYNARRYDEAIAELKGSLELDPGAPATYYTLTFVYHQKGMLQEAVAEAERGMRMAPHRMTVAELGRLAAQSGRRADALKALAEVTAAGLPPNEIATLYEALGDRARAFEFLQRAERERSTGLLFAKFDPALDSFRGDPRFTGLLRALRLSQ